MPDARFWIYLLVTAGVTYLVRAIPLVLCKKQITNRFVLSFLHYMPCSILTIMTVPGIFSSTGHPASAAAGFACAVFLAFRGKSLVQVAAAACGAVFLAELILR